MPQDACRCHFPCFFGYLTSINCSNWYFLLLECYFLLLELHLPELEKERGEQARSPGPAVTGRISLNHTQAGPSAQTGPTWFKALLLQS